jgi:hypothetical protein
MSGFATQQDLFFVMLWDQMAIQLENITIDKGEFSKKHCEKLDRRFSRIMGG